ncbi:TPA: GntR family transcriptional regulator [Clostridioides difficile]|nr:GntR family transcriptional regulator [Clostridioides difficile]
MKKKTQYLIIFEHIIQQIYTGKITVGDRLDSIQKMSKEYMVSKNTIKTVIKMLSEKGFIETKAGSRAVLIHNTSKQSTEPELSYERILQISEIYQIFSFIFPSIAVNNVKRFTSKDFQELHEIINCMDENNSDHFILREQWLKYIQKLISKTNNTLIHSFCNFIKYDVIISQMDYNVNNLDNCCIDFFSNKYIEQLRKVYLYGLNGDFIELKKLLTYIYESCRESTLKMIKNYVSENIDVNNFNSVSLEKCYLYDLIVSDIIYQIFEGNLKIGDCLPSITSVINKYNVSLPTVRNAYNKLNELGIAKTINGKGTYIILFSEYNDDYIKTEEGIKRLNLLLDAMEFIAITFEDIVLLLGDKIDSIDVEEIETHLSDLQHNCEEYKIYPDFVLLCKIIDYTQIYVVQETFLHLKQYIIFGIYLERFFHKEYNEILKTRFGVCFEILRYLKKGDIKNFAEAFSNLFKGSFENLKSVISSLNQ